MSRAGRCIARHYCNAWRLGGFAGPLCAYCDEVETLMRLWTRVLYADSQAALVNELVRR